MHIRNLVVGLAAAAVLVGLSGCSPTTPPVAIPTPLITSSPEPVVTPSQTPIATPTPTPTADPNKRPLLADLTVSADGLGPLVIGQPVPTTGQGAALAKFNPQHCASFSGPSAGGWDIAYPGRSFSFATHPNSATGKVAVILVQSKKIATSTGIRIGTGLTQLKAAYGQFDATSSNQITTLYIIRGSHGQLAIEVAKQATFGNSTPYWSAAQVNRVQFMSVWPLSSKPTAFSGTDGGPGSCA